MLFAFTHSPRPRALWLGALTALLSWACSQDGPGSDLDGDGANGGAPTGGTTSPTGGASTGTGGALGNAGEHAGGTQNAGGSEGDSGGSDGSGAAPASGGSAQGSGGASQDHPACHPSAATGHFQLEKLDRGLVAVRSGAGNYVGWRMLGYEYAAAESATVAYKVYRDGDLIATVTDSTNYQDATAPATASYTVSAVIDDVECLQSAEVKVLATPYLRIPLTAPPGGMTASGAYSYTSGTERLSSGAINDGSPGDVDGDGEYEIVVLWEPSNAQDNSNSGHTGPVYMDCYKLDGTRLWRLNLGPNIRAGAHYTQFLVYDFDGDGKAEVAVKTAPGTRDGTGAFLSRGPAANDDDNIDYRNNNGYVLSGPEYLTIFEGETGKELATVNFEVPRGTVSSWGDSYGNRVDRFLASVGFVSDQGGSGKGSGRPAILMARGYYTRATVTAYTWRGGQLSKLWTADSNSAGSGALAGQGAHSMAVADVDGDEAQEIIYGAAMIQSDGSFGCATGLGHGDALHVGDLIPSRPGLEVFMPHEDTSKPIWDVRDARTCQVIHVSNTTGSDNGRGVAADISAASPGAEFWSSRDDQMRSATTGQGLGSRPSFINFLTFWNADEYRETLDFITINAGLNTQIFTATGAMSNNHSKATPTLSADILGDWREEVIWRTPNSSELRVYTTTDVTKLRLYTLMHDPQYRMQVSSEMTGYNQPPHTSFHIGGGMAEPPVPNIHVK